MRDGVGSQIACWEYLSAEFGFSKQLVWFEVIFSKSACAVLAVWLARLRC